MVDDRSPTAKAFAVVSEIMTAAFMGILPFMGGYWLDNWCGTKPAFILALGAFGVVAAIYQLVRLVKRLEEDAKANSQTDDKP